MAASKMLKQKRPYIVWTGYAAHIVDLMVEDISKLPKFTKNVDQATDLTIFIYAHHKTLAMMRCHTKKRDIMRPGLTRFATTFLTLQNNQLKSMFTCEEWDQSKQTRLEREKPVS